MITNIDIPTLKLGARWGLVVNATPQRLSLQEGHNTHFKGGWVGPRVGLEGSGKKKFLVATRVQTPNRQAVASRRREDAIPDLRVSLYGSKILVSC